MIANPRRILAQWPAMAVIILVAGCGQSPPRELSKVHGWITLDGRPLAAARVEFNPAAVQSAARKRGDQLSGSFAITDEEGYYELTYGAGFEGAVRGEHSVKISTRNVDPDVPGASQERVPAIYNVRTRLKFKVEEGENIADFELSNSAEIVQNLTQE
jgi:hypothetical protein